MPQAYAWLISSVLGTLQGWLLLEPVEISWASSKEHVRDALKEAYMEKGGGDRVQAGLFHMKQRTAERKAERKKSAKAEKKAKKKAKKELKKKNKSQSGGKVKVKGSK